MEIKVETKVLRQNLNKFKNTIKNSGALPILETFFIEASENGELKLKGTDLENEITLYSTAEVKEPGALCVPYDEFKKGINTLKDEYIILKTNETQMEVSYSKGKFTIGGYLKEEFPVRADGDANFSFTVKSKILLESLSMVSGFTSKDDLRPAMTGVLFRKRDGQLVLASTDSHILGELKIKEIEEIEDFTDVIVHTNTLRNLAPILKEEEQAQFFLDNKHGVIKTTTATLKFSLIDALFPKYETIIPPSNIAKTKLTVKKDELENIVSRSKSFTDTFIPLLFDISESNIKITAENVELSRKMTDKLLGEVTGDSIKIGLSQTKIEMFLKALNGQENISLELTEPNKAIVCRFEQEHFEGIVLLMPMLV